MYNIKYITGPICRGPAQCTCSPWTYKRESTPARTHVPQVFTHAETGIAPPLACTQAQAIHYTVDVGYYAPAAWTTLNPCVLPCSYASRSSITWLPQAHPTLRIRRVHSATRLCFSTPRQIFFNHDDEEEEEKEEEKEKETREKISLLNLGQIWVQDTKKIWLLPKHTKFSWQLGGGHYNTYYNISLSMRYENIYKKQVYLYLFKWTY